MPRSGGIGERMRRSLRRGARNAESGNADPTTGGGGGDSTSQLLTVPSPASPGEQDGFELVEVTSDDPLNDEATAGGGDGSQQGADMNPATGALDMPSLSTPTLELLVAAIKTRDATRIEDVLVAFEGGDPRPHRRQQPGAGVPLPFLNEMQVALSTINSDRNGSAEPPEQRQSPVPAPRMVRKLTNKEYAEALYHAVREKDLSCVLPILAKVDNIDAYKDAKHYTALHVACENGNVEIAEALLEKDVARVALDQSSQQTCNSPAILAAERGHIEILNVILRGRGWSKVVLTRKIPEIFVVAAKNGFADILDMLIAGYREFILQKVYNRALVAAADSGHLECLKSIVNAGDVNVDHKTEKYASNGDVGGCNRGDGSEQTALHRCVTTSRSVECARFLLMNGASPNVKDKLGLTPLYYAAYLTTPNPKMVSLLLEYSANPDIWCQGELPLHAAATGGNYEVLQALLKRTTEVSAKNGKGQNCLHIACQTGSIQNIQMILDERRINPLERDSKGNTPVHCAARKGKLDAVKFLVEQGEAHIPASQNADGDTVLHLAANACASIDLIKMLLDKGERIDARNAEGRTPLHVAVLADALCCAETLCDLGADLTMQDKDGNSPWRLMCTSMPLVVQKILDKVIMKPDGDVHSKTARINLSFRALASGRKKFSSPVPLSVSNSVFFSNPTSRRNRSSSTGSSRRYQVARPPPAPPMPEQHPNTLTDVAIDLIAVNNVQDCNNDGIHPAGPAATRFNTISGAVDVTPRGSDAEPTRIKRVTDSHMFSELFTHGAHGLILHPACSVFVDLKWKFYKYYWWAYLILNFVFVASFSVYLIIYSDDDDHDCEGGSRRCRTVGPWTWITLAIADFFYFWVAVLEVFQAIRNRGRRRDKMCSNFSAFVHVILLLFVILVQPDFSHAINSHGYREAQRHISALAMIGIWLHFTLVLGKTPKIGLYISLFQKMTWIFLQFLANYIWIILGSCLALFLLFHKNPDVSSFKEVYQALMKALILMNGEFEYENTFKGKTQLPVTSELVFLLFVLIISMLLGNLLISLAVNELQMMLHEARVMRLRSTMELIENLESMIPSKRLLFFPSSRTHIAYILPNDITSKRVLFFNRPKKTVRSFLRRKRSLEMDDTTDTIRLDKDVREAILEIANLSKKYDLLADAGSRRTEVTRLLSARRGTVYEITPEVSQTPSRANYAKYGSTRSRHPSETARSASFRRQVSGAVESGCKDSLSVRLPAAGLGLGLSPSEQLHHENELEARLRLMEENIIQRISEAVGGVRDRHRSSDRAAQ